MNIKIFPCQGRCNVSMMTKTVAEFFDNDDTIRVVNFLNVPTGNETQTKYVAINGCPAKCASKEFESLKMKPNEEIVITKDFDPKNNEKYEVLLDIDEELSLVQEGIDKVLI